MRYFAKVQNFIYLSLSTVPLNCLLYLGSTDYAFYNKN
jgi:hypothetical protein